VKAGCTGKLLEILVKAACTGKLLEILVKYRYMDQKTYINPGESWMYRKTA
jgi:hypothetical protein